MCPEAHRRSASPSTAKARPGPRKNGVGRARARTTIPAAQPSGTRSLDGKPVTPRGGRPPPGRPPPRHRARPVREPRLAGSRGDDRGEATLAKDAGHGPEALRRPQLARPASAGVQDGKRADAELDEGALDTLGRGGCLGQRELPKAEGAEAQRSEPGQGLVDHVRGLGRPGPPRAPPPGRRRTTPPPP